MDALLDVDSFISTTGHWLLKGLDIGPVRAAVMERDGWICQLCRAKVSDDYFKTHPLKAEMHHIKHKLWNRCDCMHNLQCICHTCHGKEHPGRW